MKNTLILIATIQFSIKTTLYVSLMHRANSLCDDQFINNEFSYIDKVLKQNDYPQNIISNFTSTNSLILILF